MSIEILAGLCSWFSPSGLKCTTFGNSIDGIFANDPGRSVADMFPSGSADPLSRCAKWYTLDRTALWHSALQCAGARPVPVRTKVGASRLQ